MVYIYEVSMAAVDSSVYFPLSLPNAASLPLLRLSIIFLRSLSIFNFTITVCNKTRTNVKRHSKSAIKKDDIECDISAIISAAKRLSKTN